MKIRSIILALTGVSIFIYSCSNKTEDKKGDVLTIDPNDLTLGPIQHEDLTDSQLQKIKSIHNAFEEVYPITLEETIANFKSDLNIDKEIDLWMKMKESFEFVIEVRNFENETQRKEAFKLILMRTMMPSDEVKNGVETKKLNSDDVDFILRDFEDRMTK